MKLTFQEALDRSMKKLGLVPVRVNVHPARRGSRRPAGKLTIEEMFIRAAEDVGLGVYRAGAMLIFSPKKARSARHKKTGKHASAR